MSGFIIRRTLQAIPAFVGITLLTFALMRAAPGDPLTMMLAGANDLTAEDLAAVRAAYGLDRPVPLQYLDWLGRAVRGDFGQSILYRRPVLQMIGAALPNTLQLSALSLLLALGIGLPLGALAARYRGSALDQAVRVLSVVGHAVPPFWLGLLFILVLSVHLRWFPVGGMLSVGASIWDVPDRLAHLIGPVLVLGLGGVASYARYMRTELLDVLAQDFVRVARSKGLRERAVLSRHALRNALLPIVTSLGGLLAYLVSGSVVVEQVFAWPGMGRLTYEAARGKDYPVVMAVVVISSALVLASYILRDVAYAFADPRVRHS
ncbi:MAG: ABC transporter permease [Chloroflexi bacterium]|nr:ABC transporter permease [Chloroflexota bacterium]